MNWVNISIFALLVVAFFVVFMWVIRKLEQRIPYSPIDRRRFAPPFESQIFKKKKKRAK